MEKINHHCLHLNDEQMLKTAGLWRVDSCIQYEAYALAAVLFLYTYKKHTSVF